MLIATVTLCLTMDVRYRMSVSRWEIAEECLVYRVPVIVHTTYRTSSKLNETGEGLLETMFTMRQVACGRCLASETNGALIRLFR